MLLWWGLLKYLVLSWEMEIWIIHMCQETLRHILPAGSTFYFEQTHPISFGISNPKYHCYMNYVIQWLFSILRAISHNFQFNSSAEGFSSKFVFETAHSASNSTDVDALKLQLVQYDRLEWCAYAPAGLVWRDRSIFLLTIALKLMYLCSQTRWWVRNMLCGD